MRTRMAPTAHYARCIASLAVTVTVEVAGLSKSQVSGVAAELDELAASASGRCLRVVGVGRALLEAGGCRPGPLALYSCCARFRRLDR